MKKVARLRIPMGEELASGSHSNSSNIASGESSVRTTGRIKVCSLKVVYFFAIITLIFRNLRRYLIPQIITYRVRNVNLSA